MLAPSPLKDQLEKAYDCLNRLGEEELRLQQEQLTLKRTLQQLKQLQDSLRQHPSFGSSIERVLASSCQYSQLYKNHKEAISQQRRTAGEVQQLHTHNQIAKDQLSRTRFLLAGQLERKRVSALQKQAALLWLDRREQERKNCSKLVDLTTQQLDSSLLNEQELQENSLFPSLSEVASLCRLILLREQDQAEAEARLLQARRRHHLLRQKYSHLVESEPLPPQQDLKEEWECLNSACSQLEGQIEGERREEGRVSENVEKLAGGEALKKVSLYLQARKTEMERNKAIVESSLAMIAPLNRYQPQLEEMQRQLESLKAQQTRLIPYQL